MCVCLLLMAIDGQTVTQKNVSGVTKDEWPLVVFCRMSDDFLKIVAIVSTLEVVFCLILDDF